MDKHREQKDELIKKALAGLALGQNVREELESLCTRPDDLCAVLDMYRAAFTNSVPYQVRAALRTSVHKFNARQMLAFSTAGGKHSLLDVFTICHPRPRSKRQEQTWQSVLETLRGEQVLLPSSLVSLLL